ncbi:MAG TPA: DUF3618 domain-containing protein [Gemmatimonadaceae bacterium]|nr:DUF3618 domain-containing protein [Gemmatimonadaceae bacterium]
MAASNVAGKAGEDRVGTDAVQIRAGIEQTRERMGETLEQIGDRLNPHHISAQVRDNIRNATLGKVENMARNAADRVTDTQHTVMDTVRSNPLPAAMVGLGLGWLFLNGRRQNATRMSRGASYEDVEYARGGDATQRQAYAGGASAAQMAGDADADGPRTLEHARERAGDPEHQAKGSASQLAERAQDAASTVTHRARTGARRVEEQFQDNPLAIGAVSLAMGLAAGFAIPTTDREVSLMGDVGSRVVDRAQGMARETADKVQHVASRVLDEAKTTTKEASREEGLSI